MSLLGTLADLLLILIAVLPGFIVVNVSQAGRARVYGGQADTILRALAYATVIHTAAAPWTIRLAEQLDRSTVWEVGYGPLVAYVLVVVVVGPSMLGYVLGLVLRNLESRNKTGGLFAVLGARDDRDAFDTLFQRLSGGAWLAVEIEAPDARWIGGRYGDGASVGQSPSDHDLFLDEVWEVDNDGVAPVLAGRIEPKQQAWVSSQSIRAVIVVGAPEP